jgi:DNA polymerase III delta prime subunit
MIPTPKTVAHTVPGVPTGNSTILLFGPTGSGKTAQIGVLAEYLFKNFKKKTRLYSADKGGWDTIRAYVELGIIEAVPLIGNPWLWVDNAVKGNKLAQGKWVPGIDPEIGLYAYEGMTSIADSWMEWLAEASGRGVNVGGSGSFSFQAGEAGSPLKIGSNNMAHYSVVQQQVFQKSIQSQYLPGMVLWTAGDRRGEDDVNGGVVGPQIAGKAMTGEAPRWFKYTFRIATEVQPGVEPVHVLYLDSHIELQSKGMAKAISNARIPLAGGDVVNVPYKIAPADIVQALELLAARQTAAKDAIRARLGL